MIFGITGPKKLDFDEHMKNNARNEILVLIEEYEKTGLNIEQISAMLVQLMGNSYEFHDMADPENKMGKMGLPYHPSVISTEVEYNGDDTHTLTIQMSVTGRREVVHAYRKMFIDMMDCAKVHHK